MVSGQAALFSNSGLVTYLIIAQRSEAGLGFNGRACAKRDAVRFSFQHVNMCVDPEVIQSFLENKWF